MIYKDSYRHEPKGNNSSRQSTERKHRRSVKKGTDALFQKISEIDISYWSRTLTNNDRYNIYQIWRYHKDEYDSLYEFVVIVKDKFGNLEKARELKIKDLLKKS